MRTCIPSSFSACPRLRAALLLAIAVWLLPALLQAQNGTSQYDAIYAGSYNSCGGGPFTDHRNNYYYNGVYYSDNYNSSYNVNYRYSQPSPDVWYSFTVSGTTDVQVSLCGSGYDTYLHLLNGSGSEILSNDDSSCGLQSYLSYSGLGPGTYYVVVEGYSTRTGDFTLQITASGGGSIPLGANMTIPVEAGTFSSSGSYSHTMSNADACLGNDIGQPSNDIYYRFTLTQPATVKLSHCGSGIDTYMWLLNVSGGVITYNDDNSSPSSPCPGTRSYIETSLPAGTYYVVSEGYYTYSGSIVTNIEVIMTPPVTVSYPATPQDFTVGTAITPIVPEVSGTPVFSGQVTTTCAGSGLGGFADGPAASARFDWPLHAALDGQGNLYVPDSRNQRIRKISPSGTVSTYAGSGLAGSADGAASTASFRNPIAVAVDAPGNVYVADQQNHKIRKISPSGVVSTVAGSGTAGFANGTGTAAMFNLPAGLCIDEAGNLYVGDSGNHRIRRITPSGVVSTIAGTGAQGSANGPAASATFRDPRGLTADASGNLIVADRQNHQIRRISPSGEVSTIAGSGVPGATDGTGTSASFNMPHSVTTDPAGTIYVADQGGHKVRRISPEGAVSTVAGASTSGNTDGSGPEVRFNTPYGICADPQGNLYVADTYNNKIRKIAIAAPFSISPQLPAGLQFNTSDGTISGTPSAASPPTVYTITAYNAPPVTITISVTGSPASPSQDQNYIITYTPRTGDFTTAEGVAASGGNPAKVQTTVAYFDGLGRPLQTVQLKGSGDATKDVVTPIEYDAFGREARKYLPYASGSNNGSYKPDALTPGAGVFSFYNPSGGSAPELPGGIARTPVPFAGTRFEPSPLNRVEEQGAPGADWQIGSGHTVRSGYYTNEADGLTTGSGRWAKQYGITIDGSGNRTLTDEGSYGKNQLYVTELKDENWKEADGRGGTSQEYKDKEGKIVLKRTWKDDSTPLSTYYVYDDFGNLSYVLPPKAEPDSGLPTAASLNELCYQYRYDERNRMSEKKLPGKDREYIVYNRLDQVVATQDGEQRQRSEWLVTKYDGLGRVVMTGLWQSSMSPGDLKTQVYGSSYQWDVKDYSKSYGYELRTYPQTLTTVFTVNYYDDYDFPWLPEAYKRTGYSQMTRSLLTISRTAVLNNPEHLLWNVNYYDDRGRVTKNISQHYKGGTLAEGNYDETDNTYSFTDELITSTRSHKVNGAEQLRIITEHEYDHTGRLVNTWKTTGAGARTLLAQHVYNEVGQLQEKRLHSADQGTSFLQKQEYAYNERGWLTRINDPASVTSDRAFGMQLSYNGHSDSNKRQYNGNISSTQWQTRVPSGLGLAQEQQGYDYSYDKLSRLELAAYTTEGKAGHFNEQLSYDKGGNILTLSRTGNGAVIDQLSYMYENSNQSNRLQSVTDGSGSDEGQPLGTAGYTYDSNGNLSTDSRKGLSIEYNYLNLPRKVTKISTNETITYLYDAAGRKLRKEVTGGNRDYIGGIEYGSSGQIEFIQTEEGRAVNTGSGYNYEYMLKDHLGNTRAVVKQDGSILQTPDYYAFGLELNRNRITPSPDNRYKYNGKELQTELGMEQYDYGARFYDPLTGRFTTVDPKADQRDQERWTPYHYVLNNPVGLIDPDGKGPIKPKVAVATTAGGIIGGSLAAAGTVAIAGTGTIVGAAPSYVVAGGIIIGGVLTGGAVWAYDRFFGNDESSKASSFNSEGLQGGEQLPPERLQAPPEKRGNAPIGDDGHPVELHHRDQTPTGPIDEKTRTDHRKGDNYKKNHSNTGQKPSTVDRKAFKQQRGSYWESQWDSGRFSLLNDKDKEEKK